MSVEDDELGKPVTLAFPLKGIDTEHPFDLQPPGTTPDAINVCAVDPDTSRARGGSRPGLGRFLPQLPTRAPIQHLQIIVDPQADALTADFGDLPLNYMMFWDWIDDPSVGVGHISGLFRNRGQVRKGGDGRDTGWNYKAGPTKIFWGDPADITQGEPLTGAQLNASAVEAPAGIIAIPGTFTYQPPAGTVLGVGRATLKVKFTPTDAFWKGCMGQAHLNVIKDDPDIDPNTVLASVCITNAGAPTPPGTLNVKITFTPLSGLPEKTVSAKVDPGTTVLPNTNPAWGTRSADSLIPATAGSISVPPPVPCDVRQVNKAWYYYVTPFL